MAAAVGPSAAWAVGDACAASFGALAPAPRPNIQYHRWIQWRSSSSIEPSIATALASSWSPKFIDPVQQNAGRFPLAGHAVHVGQYLESGARCSHSHMPPARTSRRTAAAPAGGLQAGLRLHQTSDERGTALDISISISLLLVRHVEEAE